MSDKAFPTFSPNYQHEADFPDLEPVGGLTKRELFAAMVLQASLSYPIPEKTAAQFSGAQWVQIMAQSAVVQADALLAELAKAESE